MDKIILHTENEVYFRVEAPEHVKMSLSEHFTFFVPGYKFMPAYRNRIWDGKIRLFNTRNGRLYRGLVEEIKSFADSEGSEVVVLDEGDTLESFSIQEAREFYQSLQLGKAGKRFEERDFQLESFAHCVRTGRALFVSPTGSGK